MDTETTDFQPDIIRVKEWSCPDPSGGAPLITMPNIPRPLHGVNPRAIMGEAAWNEVKYKYFLEARYKCEICGTLLDNRNIQLHELYSYNHGERYAVFERYVSVCILCHNGIHSGRTISFYRNKNALFPKEYVLKVAENCFKLVHNYNEQHGTDLRVFYPFLNFAKHPELKDEMENMFIKYNIKFYRWPCSSGNWKKWHLKYNGQEYYSPYANGKDWMEAMRHHNSSGEDRLRHFNTSYRPPNP